MTEVLKWVGTGAAIWFAVSILAAVGWALAGKRIFRKPPKPPQVKDQHVSGVVVEPMIRHWKRAGGDA